MLMLAWEGLTTLATVEVHAGFPLALLGFVAVATGHAVAARRRRRDTSTSMAEMHPTGRHGP